MRTTSVRLSTHLGMQFKAHWLIKRRRKILPTPAESILLSKGINIVEAKDVLRPALIEEPYEPLPAPSAPEEKTPCYMFTNSFQPLVGIEQCQLLTNSVVFNSLPQSILDKVEEQDDDKKIVMDAIKHSHILDAMQDKLPHNFDVHNHPGYHPPRSYGIKMDRKITSLLHRLVLHLNRTQPQMEQKHVLEDTMTAITLKHSGELMHLSHAAKLLICARTPLPPVAEPDRVREMAKEEMPDIFPLSPFVHAKCHKQYDITDGFALSGARLAPHTVFMSHSRIRFECSESQFYGTSLMYAFSHAAAYARELNKDLTGDLEKPVTVNVVHTNGQHLHVGRFQLNTLDCTGETKNMFWHEPSQLLFQKAAFDCARPVVENVYAKPLSLLRALY